jgi:hypothetical protein
VLLPVEIPPVIPMAGIQVMIKRSSGFRAASFSTSVTLCPTPPGGPCVFVDKVSVNCQKRYKRNLRSGFFLIFLSKLRPAVPVK